MQQGLFAWTESQVLRKDCERCGRSFRPKTKFFKVCPLCKAGDKVYRSGLHEVAPTEAEDPTRKERLARYAERAARRLPLFG